MKTLVIGLGNPILGDDSVGWRVSQALQDSGELPSGVDVISLAVGGISLMEALVGYQRAIIVDSIVTHDVPIGKVSSFSLTELIDPSSGHLVSAHDTSLQNALLMGRELGLQLPDEIIMVTIEAQKVYEFSEELSPAVAAAIPEAMRIVLEILPGASQSTSRRGDKE
ncbi:MAG: hydrogenase maturation protease [Acidobacteriaceae bacterium]